MNKLSDTVKPTFFQMFNSTFFLIYNFIDQKGMGHEINVLLLDLLIDDDRKVNDKITVRTTSKSSIYPAGTTLTVSKLLTQGFNVSDNSSSQLTLEQMLNHTRNQYNLLISRSQPSF